MLNRTCAVAYGDERRNKQESVQKLPGKLSTVDSREDMCEFTYLCGFPFLQTGEALNRGIFLGCQYSSPHIIDRIGPYLDEEVRINGVRMVEV